MTPDIHPALAFAAKSVEEGGLRIIDALPVAIYITDADGRLTYFNAAAVKLAGRTPQIGVDQWCVTWKILQPDGTPLPHD